jgi:uncharacterized membrane protein HdeD (DUF308 family)
VRRLALSAPVAAATVSLGAEAHAATGGWLEPVAEIIVRVFGRAFAQAFMRDGTERVAIFVGLLLLAIGVFSLINGWRRHRSSDDQKVTRKSLLIGVVTLAIGLALIVVH